MFRSRLRKSIDAPSLTRRDALRGLFAMAAAGAIPRVSRAILPLGGSSSGGAFFSDPFVGYTQYWVDGLNGSDSNSGTSQLSAKKTIQAAYALVTTGGACINVLSTATYPISANFPFSSISGTSPTAQVVIRGLPSYTSGQLPQIVFAPSAGFYINANSNAVANHTFWKLDISSTSSSGSPSTVGLIQFLSDSAVTNLTIAFCRLHAIYGGDLASCLHVEGASSTGLLVKNTYMYNAGSTDGSGSDNAALILDYQVPAAQVLNCDFTGPAGCAVFMKRCAPQTSNNGWTIAGNRFHALTNDSVLMSEQGSGDTDGFFDTSITGNLFDNVFQAIRTANTENTLQSSRCLVQNNTFTNTVANAIAFRAMTAININSNVLMATSQLLELQDAAPFVNTISNCNNNAYLTSTGQSWFLDEFGGSSHQYTSLAAWQAATGRPELSTPPDADSLGFTTGSISSNFPNNGTGNWSVASSAPFFATGAGGTTPGYSNANCGTGW